MSQWSVWIEPILKIEEEREHLTLVEAARVLGCSYEEVLSGAIVPTVRNLAGEEAVPVRSVTDAVAWRSYVRRAGIDETAGCGLGGYEPIRGVQVVYFIRGGPLTKIGTTTDIFDRYAALRTASPVPLRIHHVTPGGPSLERQLHRQFAAVRHHGEWFNLNAIELENVRGLPLPPSLVKPRRRPR